MAQLVQLDPWHNELYASNCCAMIHHAVELSTGSAVCKPTGCLASQVTPVALDCENSRTADAAKVQLATQKG